MHDAALPIWILFLDKCISCFALGQRRTTEGSDCGCSTSPFLPVLLLQCRLLPDIMKQCQGKHRWGLLVACVPGTQLTSHLKTWGQFWLLRVASWAVCISASSVIGLISCTYFILTLTLDTFQVSGPNRILSHGPSLTQVISEDWGGPCCCCLLNDRARPCHEYHLKNINSRMQLLRILKQEY